MSSRRKQGSAPPPHERSGFGDPTHPPYGFFGDTPIPPESPFAKGGLRGIFPLRSLRSFSSVPGGIAGFGSTIMYHGYHLEEGISRRLSGEWSTALMLAFLAFVLLPSVSHADAGGPMIALVIDLPTLLPLLFVVVLVETFIFSRALEDGYVEVFYPVLRANVISSLAGLPFAAILALRYRDSSERMVSLGNLLPCVYSTHCLPHLGVHRVLCPERAFRLCRPSRRYETIVEGEFV